MVAASACVVRMVTEEEVGRRGKGERFVERESARHEPDGGDRDMGREGAADERRIVSYYWGGVGATVTGERTRSLYEGALAQGPGFGLIINYFVREIALKVDAAAEPLAADVVPRGRRIARPLGAPPDRAV